MNKFLEIIYMNQIMDEDWDKCEENFAKFKNRLKEIVSNEVFEELDELLTDCITENNAMYAVDGMKLAIGVLDGAFIPKA